MLPAVCLNKYNYSVNICLSPKKTQQQQQAFILLEHVAMLKIGIGCLSVFP